MKETVRGYSKTAHQHGGYTPITNHFFVEPDGTYPSGLTSLILSRLDTKYNVSVEYDRSQLPTIKASDRDVTEALKELKNFELRPYAIEAIEALRKNVRGIWKCATNSGKTYMVGGAIHTFGLRTLFITAPMRASLMPQVAGDFRSMGLTGIECIAGSELVDAPIVIASGATLVSRFRNKRAQFDAWVDQFDFVIYDECHELTQGIFEMMSTVNCRYRLFMSGTPFKKSKPVNNYRLLGLSGQVIYTVTNKYLIDNGYSAQPYVFLLKYRHKGDVAGLDYQGLYDQEVSGNDERSRWISQVNDVLVKYGLTVVTFVWKKDHARRLLGLYDPSTRPKVSLGDVPLSERKAIYEALGTVHRSVISNVVMSTGLSLPPISGVIAADAKSKDVDVNLQRAGRGLRIKKTGKNILIYVDIQDVCKFLSKASRARAAIMRNEKGFIVQDVKNLAELDIKLSEIFND